MRLPGLGDEPRAVVPAGPSPTGAGMASHERPRGVSDDWLTPPRILAALGPFDLDPCDTENGSTGARNWYSWRDDGLDQPWVGRVWCNPPYSAVGEWMRRLALHGDGVALTFARTETTWFQTWVWPRADALLFLAGRLSFRRPDGTEGASSNSGAPSVLIAYGAENASRLLECGLPGAYVTGTRMRP